MSLKSIGYILVTVLCLGGFYLYKIDVENKVQNVGLIEPSTPPSNTRNEKSSNLSRPKPDQLSIFFLKTPPKKTHKTTADFTFDVTQTARVACLVDGKPYTPCKSPVRLSRLRTGKHSFQISASSPKNERGPIEIYRWEITKKNVDSGPNTIVIGVSGGKSPPSNTIKESPFPTVHLKPSASAGQISIFVIQDDLPDHEFCARKTLMPTVTSVKLDCQLTPGKSYKVHIEVLSNEQRPEEVDGSPFSFKYSNEAHLDFSEKSVDFGQIESGKTATQQIELLNKGHVSHKIKTMDIGAPFAFAGGKFPGTGGTCTKSNKENCTVVIEFSPDDDVEHISNFNIEYETDYEKNLFASVELKGKGTPFTGPATLELNIDEKWQLNNCVYFDINTRNFEGDLTPVQKDTTVRVLFKGDVELYSQPECQSKNSSRTVVIREGESSVKAYLLPKKLTKKIKLGVRAKNLQPAAVTAAVLEDIP